MKLKNILLFIGQWSIIFLMMTSVPFITTYLYLSEKFYYPVIFILNIIILIILILLILLIEKNLIKIERKAKNWISFLIFGLVGYFIFSVYHLMVNLSTTEARGFIGNLIKVSIAFYVIFFSMYCYQDMVKRLFIATTFMTVLSIILFFMLVSGFFLISPEEVLFENRLNFNFFLGNTNVYWVYGQSQVIRIAGFMEEPGALALLLTFSLILNELTLRSILLRILFVIGGLLTFSLAFFISLFFFIVFWIFNVKNIKLSRIVISFMITVPLSLAITALYKSELVQENAALTDMVEWSISRFSYDQEKGIFQGDNRFQRSFDANSYLFGDGLSVTNVSSPQALLMRYGIITSIMVFLFLPFLFYRMIFNHGYVSSLLWFIIFINLLQRPEFYSVSNILLITLIYLAPPSKLSSSCRCKSLVTS